MNASSNSVSACQLCQHYNPEGRRGGLCGKLDVHVSSTWEACSLAVHPFETSWQTADSLNSLVHESLHEAIFLTNKKSLELQEINMRSLSFADY